MNRDDGVDWKSNPSPLLPRESISCELRIITTTLALERTRRGMRLVGSFFSNAKHDASKVWEGEPIVTLIPGQPRRLLNLKVRVG